MSERQLESMQQLVGGTIVDVTISDVAGVRMPCLIVRQGPLGTPRMRGTFLAVYVQSDAEGNDGGFLDISRL